MLTRVATGQVRAAWPPAMLRRGVAALSPLPLADDAGRLAFLDGWRGMAIALVLAGHLSPYGSTGWGLGSIGVDCFFVLSGRLMAEILIVRRQRLGDFAVRRAARLLPALWFYVLCMTLPLAAASAWLGLDLDYGTRVAAALGFFHNYLPVSAQLPYFDHSWSLAVEEHSYLLLAALAAVTVRRAGLAAACAFALAGAAILNGVRLLDEPSELVLAWRTDVRASTILLSFGLHLTARRFLAEARGGWWGWVSGVTLAGGLALMLLPGLSQPLRIGAGGALLAISVCTLDRAPAAFRRLFERPPLVALGLVSYSLYLWQQPFFLATRTGLPAALALPLMLAVALLSFRLVEQPARRAINARWRARGVSIE
jgi:peptidoglycan/LPS O-acetylase OafA/YrhL